MAHVINIDTLYIRHKCPVIHVIHIVLYNFSKGKAWDILLVVTIFNIPVNILVILYLYYIFIPSSPRATEALYRI